MTHLWEDEGRGVAVQHSQIHVSSVTAASLVFLPLLSLDLHLGVKPAQTADGAAASTVEGSVGADAVHVGFDVQVGVVQAVLGLAVRRLQVVRRLAAVQRVEGRVGRALAAEPGGRGR